MSPVARRGEASDDQRRAFAQALALHLEGHGDKAALAAKVGVNANTPGLWLKGKEPSRRHVFAIERALDLPPGSLAHLLGYLPTGGVTVEVAIDADPGLPDEAKVALRRLYRGLLEGE